MNDANSSPAWLTDYIELQDELADYAYDRMLRATEPGEAERYEALQARRINRSAVARAEREGL